MEGAQHLAGFGVLVQVFVVHGRVCAGLHDLAHARSSMWRIVVLGHDGDEHLASVLVERRDWRHKCEHGGTGEDIRACIFVWWSVGHIDCMGESE